MFSVLAAMTLFVKQGMQEPPRCTILFMQKRNAASISLTIENTSKDSIILVSPDTPTQILDNGHKLLILSTKADEEAPCDYSYTPKFVNLPSGQKLVFNIAVSNFKNKPSDIGDYTVRVDYSYLTEREMSKVQHRAGKSLREMIIALQHILECSTESRD